MSRVARFQWDDAARRLGAEGDPERVGELEALVDLVIDELRKRLGSTFTLDELAAVHRDADDWAREVVLDARQPESRVRPADVVLVLEAACGRYARGAEDYRP